MKEEFEKWFDELENYSYRHERFYDDVDFASKTHNYKLMVEWLFSAYQMGYNDGQRLYGGTE